MKDLRKRSPSVLTVSGEWNVFDNIKGVSHSSGPSPWHHKENLHALTILHRNGDVSSSSSGLGFYS